MPLVLDGSGGISGVDGTASNPSYEGTDSNTGIFYPAADTVAIGTGGTEALRVNSSQNVGIGTSSPASKLHVTGLMRICDASAYLLFRNAADNTSNGVVQFPDSGAASIQQYRNEALYFATNNTERARITSGGEVLFGATSNIFSRERVHIYKNGGEGLTIQNDNNNYSSIFVKGINSGTCTVMLIRNSADTTVGSITHNGTNTTYGTTSDYRLKHGMQPMTGALAKVQALKPVTYKWNADNSDGEGFIAHELQEVCPDAVVGEKDAVDEEGKPVYQAIDTSFLVATLTAAIQELNAKVEAQAAEIAELKGNA